MLIANQQEIYLGDLKFGSPYSFKFIVKNASSQPIKINKLVVGCGSCTTAATTKSNLLPGETSNIDVTFTPGSTGAQSKNVSVDYSEGDAHMPALILKFRAQVQ